MWVAYMGEQGWEWGRFLISMIASKDAPTPELAQLATFISLA